MLRRRVLDIGAGAGRVALSVQTLGLDVVALDVSRGAIEVCAARGVRNVFHGSMTDLFATALEEFNTFVLAGNNLAQWSRLAKRTTLPLRPMMMAATIGPTP